MDEEQMMPQQMMPQGGAPYPTQDYTSAINRVQQQQELGRKKLLAVEDAYLGGRLAPLSATEMNELTSTFEMVMKRKFGSRGGGVANAPVKSSDSDTLGPLAAGLINGVLFGLPELVGGEAWRNADWGANLDEKAGNLGAYNTGDVVGMIGSGLLSFGAGAALRGAVATTSAVGKAVGGAGTLRNTILSSRLTGAALAETKTAGALRGIVGGAASGATTGGYDMDKGAYTGEGALMGAGIGAVAGGLAGGFLGGVKPRKGSHVAQQQAAKARKGAENVADYDDDFVAAILKDVDEDAVAKHGITGLPAGHTYVGKSYRTYGIPATRNIHGSETSRVYNRVTKYTLSAGNRAGEDGAAMSQAAVELHNRTARIDRINKALVKLQEERKYKTLNGTLSLDDTRKEMVLTRARDLHMAEANKSIAQLMEAEESLFQGQLAKIDDSHVSRVIDALAERTSPIVPQSTGKALSPDEIRRLMRPQRDAIKVMIADGALDNHPNTVVEAIEAIDPDTAYNMIIGASRVEVAGKLTSRASKPVQDLLADSRLAKRAYFSNTFSGRKQMERRIKNGAEGINDDILESADDVINKFYGSRTIDKKQADELYNYVNDATSIEAAAERIDVINERLITVSGVDELANGKAWAAMMKKIRGEAAENYKKKAAGSTKKTADEAGEEAGEAASKKKAAGADEEGPDVEFEKHTPEEADDIRSGMKEDSDLDEALSDFDED